MAILVSPGVSVTVTDESQYGASGPGTVPLLIIATSQDKIQPGSTTAVAQGTTKANAGKLFLITSQRDSLQTFGNPTFYNAAGSVQYDNELNELGLFTLYEYLGIANTAYVIRADIDLGQLIPTTVEPSGPVRNGQYWLDLTGTKWGVFRSNGNPNSAFSWQAQTPLVINDSANLDLIAQGHTATKITSGSSSCISASGNLFINGVSVALAAGDSLSTVASKINSNSIINLKGLSAMVYSRKGKYSLTSSNTGDVYNLRLVSAMVTQSISLVGSTPSILTDLGFNSYPSNVVIPAQTYGSAGEYAINTLASADGTYKNELWEKISITNSSGSSAWWFKVGSIDDSYPGWGWAEAEPRVLTGTVSNPTFTAGNTCTIQIGGGSSLTVTVPASPNNNLLGFVSAINTQLNSGGGRNAVASVYAVGGQNYLRITNYDATDISINDVSDQYGIGHPWRDAGISPTTTYWASVTGSTSNPTFTAATLLTQSADTVAPGSEYNVGENLTVSGGTRTTASVLTIASIQVVGSVSNSVGSGYRVNDTITFSGSNYAVEVILTVDAIDGSGGVTGVSIIQAGQFTGVSTPTTAVIPTSTNGNGINATFDLTWGVNTVTVGTPGSYTVYPVNPVTVTGGTGNSATFDLTSGWLQSTTFSVQLPGQTPVIIHVPASPNNTLDGVVNEVNDVAFPNGPIVASKTSSNRLVLTNTNGTSFTVEDIRGTPLGGAGIAAGVTFGRKILFQGYQPSLTVPSDLASIAPDNVWINTTSGGLGAKYSVKKYSSNAWQTLNTSPSTGTVPMYDSTTAADAGFGAYKAYGSVFVEYNSDGDDPAEANFKLKVWDGTTWADLSYIASATAPMGPAEDGTLWYNTDLMVDIMVNSGVEWLGYKNMYPGTDPNGPLLSSAEPTAQSTGGPLVDYDIWVNTDVEPYPNIYRYNALTATWDLIDNKDRLSSAGIIFADARPNSDGTETGSTTMSDMVLSNYTDEDAPDALLYPPGMLLFNARYSTYNVKVFRKNYLTSGSWRDRWVTFSGNAPDGTPYMGSMAQRMVVVAALNAAMINSTDARAEENFFNLIATPGYTECLTEMVALNTDKNNVAFVVADTPWKLPATGTSFVNWANNAANAAMDGPDALITHSPYAAVYYPWGLTPNLSGVEVVVPPSLIALRTIAYNDQVAYPWFAPAGFNRGLVTGVSSVGYLDSAGDYIPVKLGQGQRDVLYQNSINPIAYIPGRGLVVYGQKTLDPVTSALDRINVSRLINYLVYNLENLAKPFLFEPNDKITRSNVVTTFNGYLQNLVSLRALYDFAVVCDTSNNTPTRIDQNQLWIDIAIKPEKAIEFIYIPIRVLNTGAPLPGGRAA